MACRTLCLGDLYVCGVACRLLALVGRRCMVFVQWPAWQHLTVSILSGSAPSPSVVAQHLLPAYIKPHSTQIKASFAPLTSTYT